MALVAFTMLALMALAMLALVTFTVLALTFAFVVALVAFTFMVALLALHELDATHDEILLFIEAEVLKVFPSGLHFFALGFHFGAFGFAFLFLFFGQFRHFMLALVFTIMLALVFTFVLALMLTFMLAFLLAFVLAFVFFTFLAARFAFALVALGHLGIHLGKEGESLLVQFSLGGIVHLIPLGIFSFQGAEGAVMLFGNCLRLIGLLRLFGSVVASHHEEASKTHC